MDGGCSTNDTKIRKTSAYDHWLPAWGFEWQGCHNNGMEQTEFEINTFNEPLVDNSAN